MTKPKPLPTIEYLQECLIYDPSTGVFTWRKRPRKHFKTDNAEKRWNGKYPGTKAGTCGRYNYTVITIDASIYRAHRLAYLMHYGFCPKIIDHIDRDPSNNKISNLRPASHWQNCINTSRQEPDGQKYVGVRKPKGKNRYPVGFRHKGKFVWVGSFIDEVEAAKAYDAAVKKHRGEFAKLNFPD